MVDIYLPKNRALPYREIPAQFPGDHATIVMDGGSLDGHQFEEIEHKVKEDAADRFKRSDGRYRGPIRVRITRYISRTTGKIVRYVIEQKRED